MMTMKMIDDEEWGDDEDWNNNEEWDEPTNEQMMELEESENIEDLLFTEECRRCGKEYSLFLVKSIAGDILCPHCDFYYGGSEW